MFTEIVFGTIVCFCLGCVVYSYLGFFGLLWIWSYAKRRRRTDACSNKVPSLPFVSLIVAAYNEEKDIRRKIHNCIRQQYPKEHLEIIIASDGSRDKTLSIAREYEKEGIVVHDWFRAGKAVAQNNSVALAKGEIIVFSDAGTMLAEDFLLKIVRPFEDPRVGCVDGELHYINEAQDGITHSEGLYWKFEMLTRRLEGEIGLLPFVSGACFAIRKSLYVPVPNFLDGDVVCPLHVLGEGYRVEHSEKAKAFDRSKVGIGPQFSARARVAMRSLSGVFRRPDLLDPFRRPALSLIIFSHRLLRWWGPILLTVGFAANIPLIHLGFFGKLFVCQLCLYVLAAIGFWFERTGVCIPLFSIPFSFVLANAGMLVGTIRWAMGRKMVIWETASGS